MMVSILDQICWLGINAWSDSPRARLHAVLLINYNTHSQRQKEVTRHRKCPDQIVSTAFLLRFLLTFFHFALKLCTQKNRVCYSLQEYPHNAVILSWVHTPGGSRLCSCWTRVPGVTKRSHTTKQVTGPKNTLKPSLTYIVFPFKDFWGQCGRRAVLERMMYNENQQHRVAQRNAHYC